MLLWPIFSLTGDSWYDLLPPMFDLLSAGSKWEAASWMICLPLFAHGEITESLPSELSTFCQPACQSSQTPEQRNNVSHMQWDAGSVAPSLAGRNTVKRGYGFQISICEDLAYLHRSNPKSRSSIQKHKYVNMSRDEIVSTVSCSQVSLFNHFLVNYLIK